MARLLIHPGEHLADELKALGMSTNELAKELGVPTNRITEIIRASGESRGIRPYAWDAGLARGRISG
jgi:plasmid maintenance system antidote protein VapI